jgi:hypothetical protein
MCFPWEFPSGWKTVESSGSKSLVFFGQSMYIFSVRCNILQAGDAGAVNGESLVVTAKGLESNEILLVFDLVRLRITPGLAADHWAPGNCETDGNNFKESRIVG